MGGPGATCVCRASDSGNPVTVDGNANRGVGATAKEITERTSALARLEVELATLELKRKAGALGAGAGVGVVGAFLGLLGVGFLFAAAAAGFATFLPVWLSILIVAGLLFLLAVICVLVARALLRRGTPPVPEGAIREAKLTKEAITR
jgi:Putative Actinobacterial Holin-X, holin superfamily III